MNVSFGQLPLVAKIAVGLTFNNAWWCTEEFFINRYGIWRYMPFYRANDPCLWDLAFALLTLFGLWRLSRAGVHRLA